MDIIFVMHRWRCGTNLPSGQAYQSLSCTQYIQTWTALPASLLVQDPFSSSFDGQAHLIRGGLYQNIWIFSFIFFISSNCCCTHLLANSKVLDLLDAPFQSYDGFCPCYFSYWFKNSKKNPRGILRTNANGEVSLCQHIMATKSTRKLIYCLQEAHFTPSLFMTVAHGYWATLSTLQTGEAAVCPL